MNQQLFLLRGAGFLRQPERSGSIKTFMTALCILLMAVSCSKDSFNGKGPLLTKIFVDRKVSAEFSYDNDGRLLKQVVYTGSGVINREELRYYDNQGRCVKAETAFNIMPGQYTHVKEEMVYDANNMLKEINTYVKINGSYQFENKMIPAYDASGRTVKIITYNSVGGVHSTSLFKYDGFNNVASEELYSGSTIAQGPAFIKSYEYDGYRSALKNLAYVPWTKNENNIIKLIDNYAPTTTGASIITINSIKSYTKEGFPQVVNENGVEKVYAYTY